MSELQPISEAPKDGREVIVEFTVRTRAYWCHDVKDWVLVRRLSTDFAPSTSLWREAADGQSPK